MDKLDLWGNIKENQDSPSEILQIISNQAELLGEKTNGKVKADFSKVQYSYKPAALDTLRVLCNTVSSLPTFYKDKPVKVDKFSNLTNANSLYVEDDYCFNIYNEKYRYRLFTLHYKPIYPLQIEVEYGILEDKLVNKEIQSKNDLINILSDIFKSDKVTYIINEMKKLVD